MFTVYKAAISEISWLFSCLNPWFILANLGAYWCNWTVLLPPNTFFPFISFADWNRKSQESLSQPGEDHRRLSTDEKGERSSHGKTETKIGADQITGVQRSVSCQSVFYTLDWSFAESSGCLTCVRLQQPQEQHWPVVHGTSVCDILAFICCDVVVNVYEQCGERVTVATAAREMSPLLSFSFQMPRDDLCWQPEAHGFEWVFFLSSSMGLYCWVLLPCQTKKK